jgi:type IV pilus assembly protein PilO
MKVEIRGRFHQVVKFIYELGKSDRIINVENIELGDPTIVGDEVRLKGRCLATAFHAIKAKPAATTAAAAPGAAPK